jgi:hypothetical protein
MDIDPPHDKKVEQLLLFLQNQVLELQCENLEHKATLTALELYVAELLHKDSGEPKDQVRQKLVEMVRQIHQGFLETLESKNRMLAAYLDRREIEDLPENLT